MAPRYGSKEWPYVWPLKKDIVGGQEGWLDPRSPDVPKLLPTKLGRIEGELDIRNLHRQNLAKDKANQAWFRNTVKSDGGPEAMRSRLRENTRLLKKQKRLQNWEKDWSLLNQNQIAELQGVNTENAPKRITNKEAESLFQNDEQQFAERTKQNQLAEQERIRQEQLSEQERIDRAAVSDVVDKSNDGQTVIQNLENAQEGDAPGSDAERNKALGYNTSLAGNEAVYDSTTGTMKIPGQDELNKSANERLDQEQRTPDASNKGQTDQPNPNAAQQNFDKIAGAIHGLATIAKALDTGEYTPPRTPTSWDSSGVGKESWRQTEDPDKDKNRYGIPRYI